MKISSSQVEVNSLDTLLGSKSQFMTNQDAFCGVNLPTPLQMIWFFNYTLFYSDTNTVVGLPRPIHESIRTLKQVLCCTDGYYSNRLVKGSLSLLPFHL